MVIHGAGVVKRVGGAEIGETFKDVQGDSPFAGGGRAWDAKGISSSDVGDDGRVLCE